MIAWHKRLVGWQLERMALGGQVLFSEKKALKRSCAVSAALEILVFIILQK